MLAKGFSMAEIIEMMKANFGLTLEPATVRSYLRQVRAANDAAAEQKPVARRGRKAKSVTAAKDAGQIDVASNADRKVDYQATGAVEENDIQQNDDGDDEAPQHDATNTVADAQCDAVSEDNGYDIDLVDEFLAQFPADADLDMEGRVWRPAQMARCAAPTAAGAR